jgi:ParB family chromosome partitioning protein
MEPEMKEVPVAKIISAGNPRKDVGDIEELAASIKEQGVIEPIILDHNNHLIAGHRRLTAAIRAGLKTIPAIVREAGKDDATVGLVENNQRKDLTPIEEANAYKTYIDKNKPKVTVADLAKKLGRREGYVARRLSLLELTGDAQKALQEGKIQLGHALLLTRMDRKLQGKLVEEISKKKLSPGALALSLTQSWSDWSKQLSEAPFSTKECENCLHNGGVQSVLEETGCSMKGICLSPSCFATKTANYLSQEKAKLEKKGITVISEKKAEELEAEIVRPYNLGYKKISSELEKHPKDYAVVLTVGDEGLKKGIVRLHSEMKTPGSKAPTEKEVAETRKEKLTRRVNEYTRELVITKATEFSLANQEGLLKPYKALALYELLNKTAFYKADNARAIIKEVTTALKMPGSYRALHKGTLESIYNLSDKIMDTLIARLSTLWLNETSNEELGFITPKIGFEAKKHFVITREFLNLHTTEQLVALAEELDLGQCDGGKKTEVVAFILKADTKGKVPKSVQKYLEG